MELTENYLENNEEQNKSSIKKKRNPFNNINRKEEKLKKQQKRARIIVRNISYKATEDNARKYFEQFGKIKELNLLKRPDGKLVGCMFIQYEAVNQAAKAILKGNNKEFLGRPVVIDWALGKDEYKRRISNQIKEEKNNNFQVNIKQEKLTQDNKQEVELKSVIKEEFKDEEDKKSLGTKDNEEGSSSSKNESDSEYSDNENITESCDEDDSSHIDHKCDIKNKIKKQLKDGKEKYHSNDVTEGCTVFVKNVPFDATNNDLRKICRKFGPVYYALINVEPISGHSKGTAFIKFKTKESAELCLRAGNEFRLMDNILEPHKALSRKDIQKKNDKTKRNEPMDNRNLYLSKEGLIMSGSKAAEGVSASDMAKRHKLEQIKAQILKNLNRFVSRNRLSIHNLPLNYDNEILRKTVLKFTGLNAHECRVMRENKPSVEHPQGKSKGFGFLSFKTHQDALTALRKLNNNPNVFGSVNRPIVAFSIEDRSVHNIKQKRLQKSRENNPNYKKKLEKIANRKKKKEKNVDDKNEIQKEIKKTANKKDKSNCINELSELDEFVGVPAKPGTFVRMRSNKKLKTQAMEHSKKVSALKKIVKRKREQMMLRKEKMQIDRPKQGRRKSEKDKFSFLVDKYKKIIDLAVNADEIKKTKRKKWYVE